MRLQCRSLADANVLVTAVEEEKIMCRNIKTLFNFEPPATEDEIRASALQFVRKLSGFGRPSQANEAAFNRAVDEVSDTARRVLPPPHPHPPPPPPQNVG